MKSKKKGTIKVGRHAESEPLWRYSAGGPGASAESPDGSQPLGGADGKGDLDNAADIPEPIYEPEFDDPDHPGTAKPEKLTKLGEHIPTQWERKLKQANRIPKNRDDLKLILQEKVGLGSSFDVVLREMTFGGVRCAMLFMNGFAKDTTLVEVIKRLSYSDSEIMQAGGLDAIQDMIVPHIQVVRVKILDEAIDKSLSGMTILFVEGETEAIAIDAKSYPARTTEEPQIEKVVRGSRDGFVETMLTNVTLIRRRLRDPRLKFEVVQVGERTKSDICIAYIGDIADPKLVAMFREKVQHIKIDGMPLGEKQLEEALVSKGWNPYPTVRYSERPDVVAAHLLEGHVVLMADTSPSVAILPCTLFHLMQHAEEYRQTPVVGTYLRWVRYVGIWQSIFFLPLWYLYVIHPELKPTGMEWIGPQNPSHLPFIVQFLLAELGVDMMRMAAVHTPTPLATAMGLIAAVLIGEIAVKVGIFTNEVIMYMSVATLGTFSTPSYELGMANRLTRLMLLILCSAFGLPGFIIGVTLWLLVLGTYRSYSAPYLWPFIPFNAKALMNSVLRRPFGSHPYRPSITKPVDNTRQPA